MPVRLHSHPLRVRAPRERAVAASCPSELAMLARLGAVVAVMMAATASVMWVAG
ncbi:hypothetical protein AB4144_51500 [Rhizobiaceae sp. 2RAB30]